MDGVLGIKLERWPVVEVFAGTRLMLQAIVLFLFVTDPSTA